MKSIRLALLAAGAFSLAGCSPLRSPPALKVPDPWTGPSEPAARATGIEANWKERLAQPYVFLERHGDYRRLGDSMRRLFALAAELGIESDGAPFALFFDDPGRAPVDELRARVCLPVAERPSQLGELTYELLPRAMVVYARVPGAYPDVARSYPTLFDYLRELGWLPGGPIREVYLVNPQDVPSYGDLVTEVQIPWIGVGR